MKVNVKMFGGLRERLGRESVTVELDGPRATVDDLWTALVDEHPMLEGMGEFVRIAVDREFADASTVVEADAEVALIPPVSGGTGEPTSASDESGTYLITRAPLDAAQVREHVTRPEAGAVVVFEGVVRDHTQDHSVTRLEYETYLEMALDKLVETGREAAEQFDDLEIAIHHRYGSLEVGETAVVIATSSPHRKAAFEASRWAIARLKEVVPIWKKEIGPDGAEWVGFGP